MTELEKIQRAKMYMDKLANGVNPIDDSIIPDEDVVNNVRLSRCFFYVSGILQQVLDNGGTTMPSGKNEKLPFYLTTEQRQNFCFSSDPIPISKVSARLNELIQTESMSSLNYGFITGWLKQIGMLTTSGNSRTTKVPTPEGLQLGIIQEERMGQTGPYLAILYNEAAQHFIVDNLDAILEFQHCTTEMQGQPWSFQEDQLIADLHGRGVPNSEIALQLKRSTSSVTSRLKKIGLHK